MMGRVGHRGPIHGIFCARKMSVRNATAELNSADIKITLKLLAPAVRRWRPDTRRRIQGCRIRCGCGYAVPCRSGRTRPRDRVGSLGAKSDGFIPWSIKELAAYEARDARSISLGAQVRSGQGRSHRRHSHPSTPRVGLSVLANVSGSTCCSTPASDAVIPCASAGNTSATVSAPSRRRRPIPPSRCRSCRC